MRIDLAYLQETLAHEGAKGSQVTWLGRQSMLVSAGFNKQGERQLSTWDLRNFEKSLNTQTIDNAPGVITPYYDASTHVIILLGKGDTTIRFYEITDEEPFCQCVPN